jgi:hypothetical protein
MRELMELWISARPDGCFMLLLKRADRQTSEFAAGLQPARLLRPVDGLIGSRHEAEGATYQTPRG